MTGCPALIARPSAGEDGRRWRGLRKGEEGRRRRCCGVVLGEDVDGEAERLSAQYDLAPDPRLTRSCACGGLAHGTGTPQQRLSP